MICASKNSLYAGTSFFAIEIFNSSLNFLSGTTHDVCFKYASSKAALNRLKHSFATSGGIAGELFSGKDEKTLAHATVSQFKAYCLSFLVCILSHLSPKRSSSFAVKFA